MLLLLLYGCTESKPLPWLPDLWESATSLSFSVSSDKFWSPQSHESLIIHTWFLTLFASSIQCKPSKLLLRHTYDLFQHLQMQKMLRAGALSSPPCIIVPGSHYYSLLQWVLLHCCCWCKRPSWFLKMTQSCTISLVIKELLKIAMQSITLFVLRLWFRANGLEWFDNLLHLPFALSHFSIIVPCETSM